MAPEGEHEEEEDDDGSVIKPTKVKAAEAVSETPFTSRQADSLHAQVGPKEETLKLQETDLDVEVDEDVQLMSKKRNLHAAAPQRPRQEPQEVEEELDAPTQRKKQHTQGPRRPTEEPQEVDEELDAATQRKLLHSEGHLHPAEEIEPDDGFDDSREVTPRGRTFSLSSDDSFVDAEEKRGISQEPVDIL